jgi:hypothetical protein
VSRETELIERMLQQLPTDVSASGTKPGEEVVRQGCDVWVWGCVLEDGTEALVPFGERHQLTPPRIAMHGGQEKRVQLALRLGLFAQIYVRRTDRPRAEPVFRLVPLQVS